MLVSEETLPKLTEENQHLQKNVTKLTSQLEEAESRVQSECASRKELENSLETKVKEVETSWSAVLEEKKDNWASKEKALEEKVESQDRLLSEMKASYEVNQRLGKTEQQQDDQDGQGGRVATAELEMLHSDLERTSSRLSEVEARNEQMRLDLAQAKSQVTTQAPAVEDDPKYMRVRSENSSLMRKLDASRVEREGLKRDLDGKLRSLEREVGHLKEERDALKAKVHKWSDYDNVKEELEVLKSIEFSTGDDDEALGEVGDDDKSKGDTLEKLLLARNKKLGDELTILRVSHQDLQARLGDLQEELSRTNGDLDKSQRLNERLENDLATLQAEAPNAFPSGASVAGTYASRYPSALPSRMGRISPTSSIISGLDPRMAGGPESPVGGSGANSTILPMITAQRDRFKKRNTQLENEISQSHRSMSQLRQEIAALQKDNLNLYEKTRYISTYNRAPASSSSSAYAASPNPSSIPMGNVGGGNGVGLDKYRKAYESNISPFAAFRGRESARAYRGLSLPERLVYSVTRMVLSSRASRNLFAGYCVALHVLVFLSLYWMGADTAGAGLGQAAVGAGTAAGAGAGAAAGAGTGAGDQEWREADVF